MIPARFRLELGNAKEYGEIVNDGQDFVQRMEILQKISKHKGCVNTVYWSENGRYLLSGSDDLHLLISDVFDPIDPVKVKILPGHRANIFSAKFLPSTDDSVIVSCAGDGSAIVTDINRAEATEKQVLRCHVSTTYEVATLPQDPYNFLTCGEDGTVRMFDRRQKIFCIPCRQDILIDTKRAVCAIDVNYRKPHMLAIGCSDSTVRLYDMRMLDKRQSVFGIEGLTSYFCIPDSSGRGKRVTSLDFSRDGTELLASFSGDLVYLIDVENFSEEKVKFPVMDDESKLQLKKVRLRGDWSDTGPQARPESELNDETSASTEAGGVSTRNILGRFTNLLTRWLERQITGEEEEEEEMENREEEETTTQERNASESVTETSLIPNEEPMETSQATETCEEEKRSDISASHTIDNHLEQSGVEDSSAVKEIYSNPIASPLAVSLAPKEDIKSQLQQQPTTSAKLLTSTDFQQFPMEESKSLASPGNFVVSNEAAGKEQGKSSNVKALTVPESTEINSINSSPNNTDVAMNPLDMIRTGTVTSCEYDHNNHRVSVHREENITDFSAKIDVKLQVSLQGTCCSTLEVQVKPDDDMTESNLDRNEVPTVENSSDLPSTSSHQVIMRDPQSEVGLLRSGLIALRARRAARESGNTVPSSSLPETPTEMSAEETDARDKRRRLIVERLEEEVKKKQLKKQTFLECLEKLPQNRCKMVYRGHRNVRTMLKQAGFWGNNFIMSGSDCGHIFFWNKDTGKIITLLEADKHVVNCVRPHPSLPVLASSGIDYDVKIWSPIGSEDAVKTELIQEVVRRNELMLNETRDTVTVPAAFMIRMLASMNRVRRGGRQSDGRQSEVPDDD